MVKVKFDFGTESSPVEEGYTKVTPSIVYSAEKGYGWVNPKGLDSRDRGGPDNLRRDLVFSSFPNTFRVDLSKGAYKGTLILGDNDYAHDLTQVFVNGELIETVDTNKGEFAEVSFEFQDGLELMLNDAGGPNIHWVVNALTIKKKIVGPFGLWKFPFLNVLLGFGDGKFVGKTAKPYGKLSRKETIKTY
jgi:hypothetical protein